MEGFVFLRGSMWRTQVTCFAVPGTQESPEYQRGKATSIAPLFHHKNKSSLTRHKSLLNPGSGCPRARQGKPEILHPEQEAFPLWREIQFQLWRMKSDIRKVNVSQRAEDLKAAGSLGGRARGRWEARAGAGRPVLESERAAWTSPRNKAHGHGDLLATAHLENQTPGRMMHGSSCTYTGISIYSP